MDTPNPQVHQLWQTLVLHVGRSLGGMPRKGLRLTWMGQLRVSGLELRHSRDEDDPLLISQNSVDILRGAGAMGQGLVEFTKQSVQWGCCHGFKEEPLSKVSVIRGSRQNSDSR